MSSSIRIYPVAPAAALSERLFWPVVVLATLALGGFGYFFYMLFAPRTSTQTQTVEQPKIHEARIAETAVPAPPVAPAVQSETKAAAAAPETAVSAAPTVATENKKSPDANATAMAQPAVMKKADEPEANPYSVPSNKPFLTHEMFEKKPPPPAAGAAKPAAKPKVAAKPDDKTKTPAAPASPASANSAASSTSTPSSGGVGSASSFHGKIYVLKDGRRISTLSTVDLGDSYGVKDLNSSYLTIPKADVSEVVGR